MANTTKRIELDVTLPDAVWDEFDPVAYRRPVKGETIELSGNDVFGDGDECCSFIILRPKPKPFDVAAWWPVWLKAAAVARDEDGSWWLYADVPEQGMSTWLGESLGQYTPSAFSIAPPPSSDDWRKDIYLNPNRPELVK